MTRRQIYLDELLGRKVLDVAGKSAGRIEELIAHKKDGRYVVEEFLLGPGGFASRLSMASFTRHLYRSRLQSVPWDKLDISDPRHPRLRCSVDELKS